MTSGSQGIMVERGGADGLKGGLPLTGVFVREIAPVTVLALKTFLPCRNTGLTVKRLSRKQRTR